MAEASDILHLRELLDRRPSQLSGGQRQRVAMGRAIVRKPQVFLFDEPLSNLDAKLRTQMRTEIKLLHARVPSTVIYVTHDQVEAMTLADRIVIMRDGLIEQARFARGRLPPAGQPFRGRLHWLADHELDSTPKSPTTASSSRAATGCRFPTGSRTRRLSQRRVALGLRPDDVYPTGHGLPSAAGSQLVERNLAVSVTEPFGNETLVFVAFGGRDWVTRMLNPAPLEAGRMIGVSFDLARGASLRRGRAGDRDGKGISDGEDRAG